MKIAIMGDTHFDFWFSSSGIVSEQKFDSKFKALLESAPADVLVIAGDIGHYNAQNITCLKHLRRYYERILVTFGNHDYYLVTKSIVSKYQYKSGRLGGSRERVAEMKTMIELEDGIDYVDGNIIEIDGISFGGATGWYDGSLLDKNNHDEINSKWQLIMNDAKTIHPTGDKGAKFDDLFHEQKYRLDAVYQQCDVMISHVSPLSEWKQFLEMYGFDSDQASRDPNYSMNHVSLQGYRAFYCFDGKEYLENGSMTHWIFGHTHQNFSRTYQRENGKEIEIVCNSIGAPKKNKESDFKIKVIEV